MNDFQSIAVENLTPTGGAQTLTASYAPTEKAFSVSSKVSLQFQVDYTPHASATPYSESKYLECYMEYTFEKDSQATTGHSLPDAADWRAYTEELDNGDNSSSFFVRTFRVYSDGVEGQDRAPLFTRPLLVRRARLQVKEVGVSPNFGTVAVRATAQAI
jgi:hypothetical protein